MDSSLVCGAVLAAGAGSRAGGPKALRRTDDGTPWLALACDRLLDAGCEPVYAALGAEADEAAKLVPWHTRTLLVPDWAQGSSRAVAAAVNAAVRAGASAIAITLVDLPGENPAASRRLVDIARNAPGGVESALLRATYDGRPGHPVVIGRTHWRSLVASLHGDSGAREYLRRHAATPIECADLGDGRDIDGPVASETDGADAHERSVG